jgi:hypothetical protein
MEITRTIFKNSFRDDSFPQWNCPTCHKGNLIIESKQVKTIENVTSKSYHTDASWEPFWIDGVFVGVLKCNNTNCEENVVITGKYNVEDQYYYDDEVGGNVTTYENILTPTYFNPPIYIFPIHKEVPTNIHNEIVNSFTLYWVDTSSCANKVRVVVELILDEMKTPKTFINKKNKRESYSLHKRIELFKAINPNEADLLMAIKWIGNTGSHNGGVLTKDDLLDSYDILEHVTTKLFEKESERIKKLSKEINKRKKPIGKSKKGTSK